MIEGRTLALGVRSARPFWIRRYGYHVHRTQISYKHLLLSLRSFSLSLCYLSRVLHLWSGYIPFLRVVGGGCLIVRGRFASHFSCTTCTLASRSLLSTFLASLFPSQSLITSCTNSMSAFLLWLPEYGNACSRGRNSTCVRCSTTVTKHQAPLLISIA